MAEKITPQEARERPDPTEMATPIPMPVLMLALGLVAWGCYYIFNSGPAQPPSWGDQRTVSALEPRVAAPGAVDGAAIYAARCIACHQATGAGLKGVFPPLAGSEWVAGTDNVLIQILLHGISGPLTVKGDVYSGAMPPFGEQLNDAEIAAVVSYVRTQWGNTGPAIDAAKVAAQRAATASRTTPWNGDADLATLK